MLLLQAGVHAAAKSEQRRFRCLVACQKQAHSGGGDSRHTGRQHRRQSGSGHLDNADYSADTGVSETVQRWQEGFLSSYWAAWRAILLSPITAGKATSGILDLPAYIVPAYIELSVNAAPGRGTDLDCLSSIGGVKGH
jgi:hypothetical protein